MTLKTSSPQTPQEIRDLLQTDPSQITDQHLLALVLARGSTGRGPRQRSRSWTTVALAEGIYRAAGGRLVDFVDRTYGCAIGLMQFGIGESIGSRLYAGVELARRWRRGFKDGGNSTLRAAERTDLRKMVFHRRGKISEADLIAVILGSMYPDQENTRHLLDELGSPQDLMNSLALDAFELFRKDSILHLRLPKTPAEIDFGSFCRLFAAVELAHRYRAQAGVKPATLELGMFGLQSAQLVQLLDPTSSLDLEFRTEMIEVLRSHPELAGDFAKLDVLASDAQTESYHRAIELALLFACSRSSLIFRSRFGDLEARSILAAAIASRAP